MRIKKYLYQILLIILGIFLLLIGDGKQNLLDQLGAVGILLLLFVIPKLFTRQRLLPAKLQLLWIFWLITSLLLAFFSISPGFSISALMRQFMALAVFYLFYCYGSKPTLFWLVKIISTFTLTSIIIALILFLFPILTKYLPPMNLVFAGFGHNHLASLILIALPLNLNKINLQSRSGKAGLINYLILLFLLLGLLISFARGVLIILLIYSFYKFLISQRTHPIKKISLFLTIILALTIIFPVIFSKYLINLKNYLPINIQPLIAKEFSINTFRVAYWQQAIDAIKIQPLFGHGPGTFYLLSKRFQHAPSQYSYFAHSFPLETLAENGIIGSIPLFVLIFLIFIKIHFYIIDHSYSNLASKQFNNYFLPLFESASLLFLYSFIDYALNFQILWLLFWAMLAVLIISTPHQKKVADYGLTNLHSKLNAGMLYVTMAVLSIFYLSSAAGLISFAVLNKPDLAFSFAPFDQIYTKKFLTDTIQKQSLIKNHLPANATPQVLQAGQLSIINFFHPQDPEIQLLLAKYYEQQRQNDLALKKYQLVRVLDPLNTSFIIYYLKYLILSEQNSIFGKELKEISYKLLSEDIYQYIDPIAFEKNIKQIQIRNLLYYFPQNISLLELSRLYYLIGLENYKNNAIATRKWWLLAKEVSSDIGMYYHELASLELYMFKNRAKTNEIIAECNTIPHAHLHCKQIEPDFKNLTPPGYLKDALLRAN